MSHFSPIEILLDVESSIDGRPPAVRRPVANDSDGCNPATNDASAPIMSLRVGEVQAALLAIRDARREFGGYDSPFEERLIPSIAERFTFARAFCGVVVESSERFADPLIKKHTTLLLTVIATYLITGPGGEARGTRYHDINVMLISAIGARPCMRVTADQADALLRFLTDLTQSTAARCITDITSSLRSLITLTPEQLAVVAESAIRALEAILGHDEIIGADLIDDDFGIGGHDYLPMST